MTEEQIKQIVAKHRTVLDTMPCDVVINLIEGIVSPALAHIIKSDTPIYFAALRSDLEKVTNSVVHYGHIVQPGSKWVRGDNTFDGKKGPYNSYMVLFVTNVANAHPNHPPQVVYQGDNGRLWSLPLSDWPGSLVVEEE